MRAPQKALERKIHQEMLIKTLAYEKMNDLKHSPNKNKAVKTGRARSETTLKPLFIGNATLQNCEFGDRYQ